MGGTLGVQTVGVGLGDVEPGANGVVEHNQDTSVLGLRSSSDSDGLVQVENSIRRNVGRRSHGASDDDDHIWEIYGQVQEKSGLFKGIGTVGDDEVLDPFVFVGLGDLVVQD
ncbi:hypothetical protein WICPIJ_008093 [Wickerhamomyces pijperi]|uniref:Uncharacterized protein n=1 Tax=Wickerhamomyces pijperi TaxID=599730 RepID=A0A9P8Q0E7_WICPI|nr:hypothetical protein WICPIJ_008093 [Wickerhamomyces pijperi]